ncbi:MAG: ribosome hibernation-promoting factor, HPF/YfiA family [Bdellovibrionales bacterium]
MELTINGKHLDVGDALRTHIQDKMEDINEKYFNRGIESIVTLGKESNAFFKTHVSFRVGKDILVQGTAQDTDPYGSFDKAAEKVAKQLRRYKTRLRDHHERLDRTPETEMLKANDYTLASELFEHVSDHDAVNDDDERYVPKEPTIVAELSTSIQTMTVSEAVMRMDLSEEAALMFVNSKTNTLNMIYKRSDGNIGWVDPSEQLAAVAE